MPGPIDSLRFVHAAILKESQRIDEDVRDGFGPEEARSLEPRLAFFARLIDLHTKGEEKGLFPHLVEKEPHFADTYLFDHQEETGLFEELQREVQEVAHKDVDADVPRLRRLVSTLRAHMEAHIKKENDLVLPLVGELFSPEEQGGMLKDILSTIAPADMGKAVPWIVDRLDVEMAERYVRALLGAWPPPMVENLKGWLKDGGVTPGHYETLMEKVPELRV
jgi:hypothetical protein